MSNNDVEGTSKVISNTTEDTKSVPVERTMLVDDQGYDIEELQAMIQDLAQKNSDMSAIIQSRNLEDADITRKLVISKSKTWEKPFEMDELVEYKKDELDDLHKFVCRVGDRNKDKMKAQKDISLVKSARRFPKLASGSDKDYNIGQHSFSVGVN